jgi:hypothetical protein
MPGQRHDSLGVTALISDITFSAFLGDKAFDNDRLRAELQARKAEAVIPPRQNQAQAITFTSAALALR